MNDDFDFELVNYYNWNTTSYNWVIYKKADYLFIDPIGYNGFWSQITTSTVDPLNGGWVLSMRNTAYFAKHELTGIPFVEKQQIKVFPNPFSDFIQVENFHAQKIPVLKYSI